MRLITEAFLAILISLEEAGGGWREGAGDCCSSTVMFLVLRGGEGEGRGGGGRGGEGRGRGGGGRGRGGEGGTQQCHSTVDEL